MPHKLLILLILIIVSTIAAGSINEKYSDPTYNEDKAIPIADGEFNLNGNLYLTENNDQWFIDIIQPLKITDDIPVGVPLIVSSRDFAMKMGDMVEKYLINVFNEKLARDELVKYAIKNYDIMEIIYYYQTASFDDISTQFYTAMKEKNETSGNVVEVCEVWGKYLVARDTKAWGMLLDVKTRHYRGDVTPRIVTFQTKGKVFEDKVSNVSRNIAPYMVNYSHLT